MNLLVAAMLIHNSVGGDLYAYNNAVYEADQRGLSVEISGYCLSACTMWLGASNVCVHPDAVFGFHGPAGGNKANEDWGVALMSTRYMMAGGELPLWFWKGPSELRAADMAVLTAQRLVEMRSARYC